MKVGLLASPWVPVPPPRYGGTEAVIDTLARGMWQRGHDVRLFATGDSACPVPRSSVYQCAVGTDGATVPAEARQVIHGYRALDGCDVIHDHTLFGPLYGPVTAGVPIVTTAHGPFTEELRDAYQAMADRVAIVAISHHQRSTAPELPVAAVIHHGIDVDAMPFGAGEGNYAVFLGRMSPDKGAHRAIHAARAAGVPLVLAAKMREPAERRYFLEEVEPLLGDDAVYVGEVGGAQKIELLRQASALLNPIRWDEPFGLVMIEALAVGTPVIAFPEGAAPEVVDDGLTGFIVDNEDDMAVALSHARDLNRRACRASAASRFSTQRMVAQHLALYESLLAGRPGEVIDIRVGRDDRAARRERATVRASI